LTGLWSPKISWSCRAAIPAHAILLPNRINRERHRLAVMTDSTPATASAPMQEALALAHEAIGRSDPNPRVGCVIVGADGSVLGRGSTQAAGDAHAEVMALRDAAARGCDVRGATVYVSLEPCSHHGRTPPCADALVGAGVGRVVIAMRDPNPRVSGQGAARLEAAGIGVAWGDGADEAGELNIGFVSRMERGRPWLRLKVAVSLDGRTALADGTSQWITGAAARADGHAWRKRAGALLTGVGTIRDDDPRLDVRLVEIARQPLRVIVDSRLETPPSARILTPPGEVLLYAALDDSARRAALVAHGVEVVLKPSPAGKVDLAAMLQDLGARGINELHAEAGEKLNASLLGAGLVDELLVYVAPRLIGSGRGLAALGPIERLDQALGFAFTSVAPVGDDLRMVLRPRPA
jgi:diaminohydroxyphosphoribosylaminopyrimidine deaminase/5-amino-6-(5-phosphoribosylamino)uracil reductase